MISGAWLLVNAALHSEFGAQTIGIQAVRCDSFK
jgi:hypothetical protein